MPTLSVPRFFGGLALFSLLTFGTATQTASAQEPAPEAIIEAEPLAVVPSRMDLLYLANPSLAPFEFRMPGRPNMNKNVGAMPFAYPSTLLPGLPIEPTLRTYCLEPKVPIYSGNVYEFALEDPAQARFFELPDTAEGQAEAQRRMGYIEELYGRYYQETLENPELTEPAFQIALWELVQERTVPEGPMPFNLYTGDFQANYPENAQAPAYVRLGQTYLQSLTGDNAIFGTNPVTAGQSLVRLTGVASANGVAAQSQLMLQAPPSAAPALSSVGGGGNGPLGGLGGIPTGAGGGLAPATGIGPNGITPAGLGGLGAGGLGGGLGAGFPFIGAGTGTSPFVNTITPPITAPVGPGTGTGPSTQIPNVTPPVITPPVINPPVIIPPPIVPPPEPNPIPAPPAVILGAVAIGLLGARKQWLKRHSA